MNNEAEAPYPVDKTKHIIGKYNPDEDKEQEDGSSETDHAKNHPADEEGKPDRPNAQFD